MFAQPSLSLSLSLYFPFTHVAFSPHSIPISYRDKISMLFAPLSLFVAVRLFGQTDGWDGVTFSCVGYGVIICIQGDNFPAHMQQGLVEEEEEEGGWPLHLCCTVKMALTHLPCPFPLHFCTARF